MKSKVVSIVLACAALPCFAQSNLLQITSPVTGTVVYPNQTAVISVSADPSVSNVAIIGWDPLGFSQTTNGQSLQFQLTIPSNTTIGAYDVSALGSASDGSLVASLPISLQVDTQSSPASLKTQPSGLMFSAIGQTIPLHVIGMLSNGSQLDLTHSVQTSYSSQIPAIATVDAQGVVTAVGLGSTSITATNTHGPTYSVITNVGQLAALYNPPPGSALTSSPVTFQWNGSSTATAYQLNLGSLPTTSLSQAVSNLPSNGSNIYVTLSTAALVMTTL